MGRSGSWNISENGVIARMEQGLFARGGDS
jgi:hypothetical protein